MSARADAVAVVRRVSILSLLGHLVFAGAMVFAAVDQGGDAAFALLAGCGVVGAGAAGLLASSTGVQAQGRISTATALMPVAFVCGVVAALLAGNPAFLLAPVVLALANAMVVGAARRVHSAQAEG